MCYNRSVAMKVIATNKKAYFDYFVIKSYLCGIKLAGSEVKSIRKGDCNLKDSFVVIDRKGEVYVKNMYIKPYEKSTSYACDPRASRKLLLHRSEIDKLNSQVKEKGLTIVPLQLGMEGNLVKLEIGLVRGKHTFDKKRVLAEKDQNRDLERQLKFVR